MMGDKTGRGVTETYPLWERTTLGASPSAPNSSENAKRNKFVKQI